jgi:sterol desaturase/sphingolipid hydroxylase (fatty acid hydroxylase superfamily)
MEATWNRNALQCGGDSKKGPQSMSWIMSHESAVRLGFFAGVFVMMAMWEIAAPRRRLSASKGSRWLANLGILVVGTIVVRILFPAAAVGMALVASERGWGLLNNLGLAPAVSIVVSVLVLDLVIYLQHVMFHAVPALWRLHMVHHADVDFDCTTGLRLSMVIKLGAVALLGPPAVAVIIFEVVLNATSIFNHGNVRLPRAVDRVVRWILVTPDMHRVHHSVKSFETNSNFGFNLPWWDRLLGTYRDQPEDGHESMTIGLSQFQEKTRQGLLGLLALPFTGRAGDYPMAE